MGSGPLFDGMAVAADDVPRRDYVSRYTGVVLPPVPWTESAETHIARYLAPGRSGTRLVFAGHRRRPASVGRHRRRSRSVGVGIVTARAMTDTEKRAFAQEGQLSKMTMTSDELAAVRDLYDTTDQSAALDAAELDASTVEDPMVGITIRLPASTLNTVRALAAGRGVKVTALIRDWVEQQLADNTDDQRVVSVAELRRLIAHAS